MAQLKGGTRIYGDATADGKLQVTSGPALVGTATSTGTASQSLQVIGGAYISGSVGIGTTNPTTKLDVLGDVLLGNIKISSGGTITAGPGIASIVYNGYGGNLTGVVALASPAGVNGELQFNDLGTLKGAQYFFYDKNNIRVGIGTSLPTARLSVAQTATGDSLLLVTDNVSDGTIFRVNSSAGSPLLDIDSDQTILFITNNNVGIGTFGGIANPSPPSKLTVDGTLRATGNAVFNSAVNVTGTLTAGSLSAPLDSASITIPGVTGEVQYKNVSGRLGGAQYFFYDSNNIRVGIGTSLPSARLSVANTTGDSLLLINDNVSEGSMFRVNSSTGYPLMDIDGDGTVLFLTPGNVGIGTTIVTPTSKLQVDGDLRVGKNQSNGVILTSPNGTKYRMIVDNAGTVTTTLVP